MNTYYQLGKDIGELQAVVKALSDDKHKHCKCCGCRKGRGERSGSELTPENLRIMQLVREKSEEIKKGIEDVVAGAGVVPAHGGRLNLVAFSIVDPEDPSAMPMSPWGPIIFACCVDGKYDACFQIGCDPCAGHEPPR